MDYSLKEVAGRIKDLREAKGYTKEELAKLTGVSVEEYEVLENGETDFSFTFIYKCAKACDVEVADLLEGLSINGATHHSLLIYDASVEEIAYFASLLGMKVITL